MKPERMLALFGARLDDYAVQAADGHYERTRQPVTDDVVRRHLRGEITIGLYCLDAASRGKWCCLDFDAPEREWLERAWVTARDVVKVRESSMLREFSGSKGYHLWVFVEDPVPGEKLQRLAVIIREKSGVPQFDDRYTYPDGRPRPLVEVYPKTTSVNGTSKAMGQLVKLPLGVHRKSGKLAEPLDVQGPVQPLSPAELDSILSIWEKVVFPGFGTNTPVKPHDRAEGPRKRYTPYPCTPGMMGAVWGEGGRNNAVFNLAKRLHVAGYSEDETVSTLVAWAAEHTAPPLTTSEVRRTARSGMRYTGMNCLDPEIMPFCVQTCPIFRREHPASPPPDPKTGLGPRLKVTTADPPQYHVPISTGWVKVSGDQLLDWKEIRTAAAEQLHVFLPRRRDTDWDRELELLMRDVIKTDAPQEVSQPGIVRGLLHSWLDRASDDPGQVERRSVWLDEESGTYVFRGDAFIHYVVSMERNTPRLLIWSIAREMGGQQSRRVLPGGDREIEVWEIPQKKT